MKHFRPFLLSCFLLFAGYAAEVEIHCTTDIHGRAEAFLRLAPLLREKPGAIRIDCGDTLQGTLLSRHSEGRVMTALLNELRYDVWVPGNHDFEFGPEPLVRAAREFHGKTLGAEFSRPGFRPEAWTLIERNNLKIAVIGMTDPKMPKRLLPDSGWNFEPNRDALRRIMPQLLAAKPELVVLAWHSGPYTPPGTMFRFLAEFPEIDLVLAGHSHEEEPGRKIAGAWFVQAGRYAACFARIRAEFDDGTGRLLRITSEIVRPDDADPRIDAGAEQAARPFLAACAPYAETVIATTQEPLRLPEKRDNTAPICRIGAEALKAAAGSDAAMFSVSALPQFAIPRAVTNAGLFTLLPYENELCTVELTKTEFTALLKEVGAASRRGRSVFSFAGIRVREKGKEWTAPDAPEKLTLAVTAYSLTSNPLLRGKMEAGAYRRLGVTEREAVAACLKAGGR
ncbi:MAG: bifunctional metallophosphatase/5'-nucleotidase [Lentisphaeria bacterium]|nr:bifunctional metallophosphatase/5'-nucleotidase [Lentisphaeria bacterium]